MMRKLESFYKTVLLIVFLVLVWSLWATAQQPGAGGPAAALRAAPPQPLLAIKPLDTVWLTFGLDRVELLKIEVFGQPLWQYFSFFIYIILAFVVSRLLDHLITGRLKKWAEKTETKLDDILIDLAHGPVKIIAFVILLHIGLEVFSWPAWINDLLSKGLYIVVACSLTYVATKFVDLLVMHWSERASVERDRAFDDQLMPIIRKSFKAFVVVVAVLVTSQNLGVNITSVLASLSIGGLALGLAAQDTLANLFGAVAIFVDKPFRIGDRIRLDAVDGTVETIGLRSTRVRNLDGHLVSIPNKTMGNATITNVTKRPNIKTEMNIGITYDTPSEKVDLALTILREVYQSHPKTHEVIVSFNKFEASSLNLYVIHWWNSTDTKDYLAGMQVLNLEVKRRFDAAAIEFAFPTETHYIKQIAQAT